jgi:hypothetical protein
MAAPLRAEYLDEETRCAVDHLRYGGEARRDVDEAADAHDPAHSAEIAAAGEAQMAQDVKRAEASGALSLLHRHFPPELTADLAASVEERGLPGDEDEVPRPDEGGIRAGGGGRFG